MMSLVYVTQLPICDFCHDGTVARYDFKTVYGPWAHGCKPHWIEKRAYPTLGTGQGQLLKVKED